MIQNTGGPASYEVATFADLPAANSVTVGRVYTVLGALITGGTTGTQWQSNGTFWRPASRQMLYYSATQVDGVGGGTTNEQFLLSLLLPAGVLRGARDIGVRAQFVRSAGASGTATARWRLGSAGNNTDAIISNFDIPSFLWGVNNARVFAVKSATVLRSYQTTVASGGGSPDNSFSLDNPTAEVTVPSLTGALYLSASIQQATANVTASLTIASVYVE